MAQLLKMLTGQYHISIEVLYRYKRGGITQNGVEIGFAGPESLLRQTEALCLLFVTPHLDHLAHQHGAEGPESVQRVNGSFQRGQICLGFQVVNGDGFAALENGYQIGNLSPLLKGTGG